MQTKGILLVVMLTAVLMTMTSYAQPLQDERAQTDRQQDGRYLVYMRGIT